MAAEAGLTGMDSRSVSPGLVVDLPQSAALIPRGLQIPVDGGRAHRQHLSDHSIGGPVSHSVKLPVSAQQTDAIGQGRVEVLP